MRFCSILQARNGTLLARKNMPGACFSAKGLAPEAQAEGRERGVDKVLYIVLRLTLR